MLDDLKVKTGPQFYKYSKGAIDEFVPKLLDYPFLQLAKFTSVLTKEAILKDSRQAIDDMKQGIVSDAFVNLSEIVFAVGGLGDNYARNAAAHAMHDAIGKYLPGSHAYLHGEKVAYGILYQMALEKRWALIDGLLPFYKELDLPRSLADMKLSPLSEEDTEKIAVFINSKEKVHLIPIEVNPETIKKAIFDLEHYIDTK